MKLYFSPLACSMATRIALYEAKAEAELIEIDPKTKRTPDGTDFHSIHSLGLVPTLGLDDGQVLTENAAVLQYVAERFPEAGLAPRDPLDRARLQQWLCFIGTELHKGIYAPLLAKTTPDAMKTYVLGRVESRLGWVARGLEGRSFILDRFSVADAYLFTVLNWSSVLPIDLQRWPAIASYMKGLLARPAVARALGEEVQLYRAELARNAAA